MVRVFIRLVAYAVLAGFGFFAVTTLSGELMGAFDSITNLRLPREP